MPRNYRNERDLLVERWYGAKPPVGRSNPRPRRIRSEDPISPEDGYGMPNPVNSPMVLFGHCLAWKYSLSGEGYGIQYIDGKPERVHREVYRQARKEIPDGKQINHLCDRPYCFQPSHLYAGTQQDNADDSTLFRHGSDFSMWGMLMGHSGHAPEGSLRQRVRDTPRHDGTPPWDPVRQPPQMNVNGFRCEDHDFAIPMRSDTDARICRICESTEMTIRLDEKFENPRIIAELWPVSQVAPDIFQAIWESEFASEALADQRQNAYNRSTLKPFDGTHELRTCSCFLCRVDRRAFGEAVAGNLTEQQKMTVECCDAILKEIQNVVDVAQKVAMEHLGGDAKLDDAQIRELTRHVKHCHTDESETSAGLIERVLGGAVHAVFTSQERDDALHQHWAEMISWWLDHLQPFLASGDEYVERVTGAARAMTEGLLAQWEDRLQTVLKRHGLSDQTVVDSVIYQVAGFGVCIQLTELIRFETQGRNSRGEQRPHPHEDCIWQIRETGHWEPGPSSSPFTEGKGYDPDDDLLKDGI